MRYHATITNENGIRASKGGNERLTITVADGNNIIATLVIDEKGVRYEDITAPRCKYANCRELIYGKVQVHHHFEECSLCEKEAVHFPPPNSTQAFQYCIEHYNELKK